MPRALLILIGLRWRSVLRNMERGLKRPRGMVFGIIGLCVFVLWLGPAIFASFIAPRSHSNPDAARTTVPLVLLGLSLLNFVRSSGQNAIPFTPAEVDFLFPAPFTRRHLLLYKAVSGVLGAMFGAVFFSLWMKRMGATYLGVYLGTFLAMIFLQWLSITIALLAQVAGERAYTLTRRIVLSAAGMGLIFVIMHVLNSTGAATPAEWFEVVTKFQASTIGCIVLAPVNVFGELFAAQSMQEALVYAGWAFLVDGVLLYVMLRLDANYLEASLHASQKLYDKVRRMRAGGGVSGFATARNSRLRVPQLPFLGGAGPLMWRQLVTAVRNSRGMVTLMLMLVLPASVMFLMRTKGTPQVPIEVFFAPMLGMMVFLLPQMIRFDFRGDLEHLDWLKSLPVSAIAVAIGQLATPVLVLTTIELALFGIYGVTHVSRLEIVSIIAMAVLPFNVLLLGIENVAFLLFPFRRMAGATLDLQTVGRNMVLMMAKVIVLGIAAGVAVGVSLLAFWLLDAAPVVAATAGATALLVLALCLVPAVATAFKRFDPAVDTPLM